MPLTKQNVSVVQASLHVVLVASRLYAEAKAGMRQVTHRLGEEAQHKGYRKARQVKRLFKRGRSKEKPVGFCLLRTSP